MRAGVRDSAMTIDGKTDDWRSAKPLYANSDSRGDPLGLRSFSVRSDEAYVYLRLDVGRIDWARGNYLIGIDTYREDLGDRRFPYTGTRGDTGFEFMLELRGTQNSRLLVDTPYNLYRELSGSRIYNRPFRTLPNGDGRYDSVLVTSNRKRIGRNGTIYPAYTYDRGLLRYARQDETTLADWYADSTSGVIEIRLGWGMLHVTDPSSRTVLFGDAATGEVAGTETAGFRFVVQSFDPMNPASPAEQLPNVGVTVPTWTWEKWEEPRWYAEIKPTFASLQKTFAELLQQSVRADDQRSATRPPKLNEPKR
jgi:hypothetical protein